MRGPQEFGAISRENWKIALKYLLITRLVSINKEFIKFGIWDLGIRETIW